MYIYCKNVQKKEKIKLEDKIIINNFVFCH